MGFALRKGGARALTRGFIGFVGDVPHARTLADERMLAPAKNFFEPLVAAHDQAVLDQRNARSRRVEDRTLLDVCGTQRVLRSLALGDVFVERDDALCSLTASQRSRRDAAPEVRS